jgi:metal-sulfur cluster biosynthetic enzyme
MNEQIRDKIIENLKRVYDPEIPVNIYDLGLIYELAVDDNSVKVVMTLTSAFCPSAEEIPADGFGFVTQFGFINNVNTASWALGDLLYVNPATPGLLTNVKPTAPNWTFPVAAVTRVHASSGRILSRAMSMNSMTKKRSIYIIGNSIFRIYSLLDV